ncbi:MAG: nucleotidyl transferase AbiEii/AbiGii toxin family protein [bacterium]
MNRQLALKKEQELGIAIPQIVREEYEMILLRRIFESDFGRDLVFRGGTALRLAYNSPRYSDDLDFTQFKNIKEQDFKAWCEECARTISGLELVESLQKYYTLYAQFKVTDPSLERMISIKIEISRRKGKWEKEKDYILMQLSSEITPITVLAQVATLERIEKEKRSISPLRIRDVFDLWFIAQKLGRSTVMDFSGFSAVEIKQDLHRLLPKKQWEFIKDWLPKK